MQQEFLRFTDEQELFEKMEIAMTTFHALVVEYSALPESNSIVPFAELLIFFYIMSRMNVKKKIKLMHVFESYWDMLPSEEQEQVLAYKISQECIDEERKDKMKDLYVETIRYGELKEKWNIVHARCIAKRQICFSCYKYHMKIMGCYVDEENTPRERFLGYNFKSALQRVKHVKSFL